MNRRTEHLLEALKKLLITGYPSTQEEISSTLTQQGFVVNQSKISRLLKKLSAIKIKNEKGQTVYQLPKEPAPPSSESPLTHLILNINHNESLIVIRTSPGSASLIARMLDYLPSNSEILGTLAGDDTIFVMPKSIHRMDDALLEVRRLLSLGRI